jgi:uncharacterized protein (DUF302 family)
MQARWRLRLSGAIVPQGTMNDPGTGDVAEHVSALGFAATIDALRQAIRGAGMEIFAEIDHAAGARSAGMKMPPTVLLLYGSPRGGTPVMLEQPRAALDLPLRVLVREGADECTLVAFHPVAAMLRAIGVSEVLSTKLEAAQRVVVEAVQEK